jgi:hypothetical protein
LIEGGKGRFVLIKENYPVFHPYPTGKRVLGFLLNISKILFSFNKRFYLGLFSAGRG